MSSVPEQQQFQHCPVCRGSGRQGVIACTECQGSGVVFFFRSTYLYWRYPLSILHCALRRLRFTVSATINGLLFILLVINVLNIWQLLTVSQEDIALLGTRLLYGVDSLVILFWLLLISHCYLWYRLSRVSVEYKRLESQLFKVSGKKINIADFFAPEANRFLDATWTEVTGRQQGPVQPLHLFLKILDQSDIVLVGARLGIDMSQVRANIMTMTGKLLADKKQRGFSPEALNILLAAFISAVEKTHHRVEIIDVFAALVISDERIMDVLDDYKVDLQAITNVLAWVEMERHLVEQYRRYRRESHHKPKGPINRAYTATATPIIDRFGTDLTAVARAGGIPLTIERQGYTDQLYRMLEAGKSAILLVGESGVGKDSVIEALALRMTAEDVPAYLQDKRLVSISVSQLVAGAAETGELQQRLLAITNEAINSGNIIIYIENLHNIVGVGSTGTENVDLSEVLSEQIRDPRVILLASTTPKNYSQYIEPSSLMSGFVTIKVEEPEDPEAIRILEANAGYLEHQHNVFFTYGALAKAVELSRRYLHEQFLPAKAISLMYEVSAQVAAQSQGKFALVMAENVAQLVSAKTNIPLTDITVAESSKLLQLEEIIHQRIVGQEEAVKLVVTALQRARTELRDVKRPIINLLFAGPTGVGKTELAKAVAESYFGAETRMIRLDMSEYQVQDSVARLIGVPGSGRGGILTEAVRQTPFAVLLLDEIDKAHKDIVNIFLQVMEDGRLTDSLGRVIDFTNSIIIATTNAASLYIQQQVAQNVPLESIQDHIVKEELTRYFAPEFLNRFDGIVVFKPLTPDQLIKVAGLMLKGVAKRLKDKGIQLKVTPEAQAELAQAGFDPVFGARPLRRVIQDRVDNALAQFLLKGSISRRDTVVLKPGGVIEVEKAEKTT
ncbi:MAG: AAA family ATPase [Candidatus Komeilibacteria bacterium]